MALTRAFLKGMGLTEEQVSAIIEAHTDSTDALKAQRDQYKRDADQLESVQQELDALKANGGSWEQKYNQEHEALESLRNEQAQKAETAKRTDVMKALLKQAGIAEKYIGTIIKASDVDKLELDEDGKAKDADALVEQYKTDWSDFIAKTETTGAEVPHPPATNPVHSYSAAEIKAMSPADINKNWDTIKASLGQNQ